MSHKQIWILDTCKNYHGIYKDTLFHDYAVKIFSDFEEFRESCKLSKPSLAIADIGLNQEYILEYIEKARRKEVPFVIISEVDDPEVIKAAFDVGARDYLTKPVNQSEMMIKIRRIVEETAGSKGLVNMTLDSAKFTLQRDKKTVYFTAKEYQIIVLLHESEFGLTRNELVRKIWGAVSVSNKTLDVHLHNLRKKLKSINISVDLCPEGRYELVSID